MRKRANGRSVKEEHFANLVAVAYSDGILNQAEVEFLAEKAEDYGLERDIVLSIIDKADELVFLVPINQEEKEEQLSNIVYIAMVDGDVQEYEYALCLSIAQKLGFEQKELDYIIELTKKLWKTKSIYN